MKYALSCIEEREKICFLSQELPFSCAEVVCEPELLGAVIKMTELTRDFVCASPENPNPQ